MKRRGIENVASRLRKFSEISFADHCRDWSDVMRAWRDVRDTLGDAAIEIEQLDVANDPAAVVQRLATFLDLSEAQITRVTRLLAAEQPERTAELPAGTLDLDAMDWPIDAKQVFWDICRTEMSAYAYSTDVHYFAQLQPE